MATNPASLRGLDSSAIVRLSAAGEKGSGGGAMAAGHGPQSAAPACSAALRAISSKIQVFVFFLELAEAFGDRLVAQRVLGGQLLSQHGDLLFHPGHVRALALFLLVEEFFQGGAD